MTSTRAKQPHCCFAPTLLWTASSSEKPAWAGADTLVSRVVNALIHTKPLYAVMKRQAKAVLRRTAESRGIDWSGNEAALERLRVREYFADGFSERQEAYPDYYLLPFHAYDAGNMCWEAAYEAEPATYAMALRVWPEEKQLDWRAAQLRLRRSFLDVVRDYAGSAAPRTAVDIGCSVGVSTRYLAAYLAEHFAGSDGGEARVYGVDLSPYFLAVAEARNREATAASASAPAARRIEYVQARAERLPFADGSVDLLTLQFVLHELPRAAAAAVFRELARVTRPGGVIAMVDNNPRSAVIRNLPPALFTLMKSTEPHSDDYYTFDVEQCLRDTPALDAASVRTVASDPRHRTILVRKQAARVN